MTKAELIRIISKRSGVPDSETKIFLELFLRKASSMLKKGEALKFYGLGYFQLQQGVTKLVHNKPDEKVVYSNLMVFYPIQEQPSETDEKIIFNIPEDEDDEHNEIDSYFSLSVGKPVVPLTDSNENDFFVPIYGHELKKIIEAKVEKLLSTAELITRYTKGNEILVIGSENLSKEQLQIPWGENEKQNPEKKPKKESNEVKIKTTSEFGHIAWDFGYDLAKQIEEESIIDSASIPLNESLNEPQENENIIWDFTPPTIVENLSSTDKNNEDINYSLLKKHEDELIENKEEFYDNETIPNKAPKQNSNDFEIVNSVTAELFNDDLLKLKKDENLPWNFGKEENASTKEEDLTSTKESEKIEENIIPNESKEEPFKLNIQNSSIEVENELDKNSEIKSENSFSANQVKKESDSKTIIKSYSKEKTFLPFWISLITIVAIGVALYLFLRTSSFKFPWKVKINNLGKTFQTSHTEIINRNYDIPVTYSNSNVQIMRNEIITKDTIANKNNSSGISRQNNNLKNEPILPKANSNVFLQKVKDNILKYGNNFIVQVSSWQSEFVANKEAEKFNRQGYKSSVVKAVIPGKGIWYRVRVGNFKTVDEAQKFIERNE